MSEKSTFLELCCIQLVSSFIYFPIATLCVWWMWNLNIVGWINLPHIGFWQTMGILWMLRIIFTSTSTIYKKD